MKTRPTAEEQQVLDKRKHARHIHFLLLVVLICIASLTFLFPGDFSPLMVVLVGGSICGVGISAMRLQHFQRCPRCSVRSAKGQVACASCGLEFYSTAANTEEDVENPESASE